MNARHVLVLALLGLMGVYVAWFGTQSTAELLVFALPPLLLAFGALMPDERLSTSSDAATSAWPPASQIP